jgi:biotin carboxylase
VYCAKATGVRIHLAGPPLAAHLSRSRYIASFTSIDLPAIDVADLEPFRLTIERLAAAAEANMVLPGDEHTTWLLVRLRGKLGVPCFPLPDEATFARLTDKWRFYEACTAYGVPVPKTLHIGDKARLDPNRLADALGLPLVVKPSDQGNNNGVVIAETVEEVRAKVTENPAYPYNSLIAQAFIPGADIDCSILAHDGRIVAVAVQRRDADGIIFCERPDLVEYVDRLTRGTGFTGVAHYDARLDNRDDSISLIECNPRFWGSINAARWCGLNFVALGLDARIGVGAPDTQPLTLKEGKYVPWTTMLRRIANLSADATMFSRPNRGGLAQVLSDPVPVLFEELHAFRRRREENRRRGAA